MFAVYMMASLTRTLYVGMTSDLVRRVWQHRTGLGAGFSARYRTRKLVWYELCPQALPIIAREKEVKRWSRRKKIALIQSANPHWMDPAKEWFG